MQRLIGWLMGLLRGWGLLRKHEPVLATSLRLCTSYKQKPFKKKSCTGQALVELAVFGSLMLLVMSGLVGYALNADFQQQVQMKSYRMALLAAARANANNTPLSASVTLLDDHIVADVSDPYVMGSSQTFTGGAQSPTRSNRMGIAPGRFNEAELPRQIMKISGHYVDCPSAIRANQRFGIPLTSPKAVHGCTTSGFRELNAVGGFIKKNGHIINDPDHYGQIDKYDEIYGAANTRVIKNTFAGGHVDISLIDPIVGDITSRDMARGVCAQMMNPAVCVQQCKKGKSPGTKLNCNKVCQQTLPTPWYCQGSPQPDGSYVSDEFEALFPADAGFGLQVDNTSGNTSSQSRSLQRLENDTSNKTVQTINSSSQDIKRRDVVFRETPIVTAPGGIKVPDNNTTDTWRTKLPGVPQVPIQQESGTTEWETTWASY